MVTIKNFSLCIVALSSFNLFTMEYERNGNTFKDNSILCVWNKIDKDLLGMDDCVMTVGWGLRSLVGTYLSVKKSYCITPQNTHKDLQTIWNWIGECVSSDVTKKDDILKKLVAHHWYVNYVMQAVVNENIRTLEDVTGRTIDTLFSDIDKERIQDIVFSDVYKKFFNDNLGKKKLIDIMPLVISDIHFTVLYSPGGEIQPDSLMMSSDGKYLQAKDEDDVSFTWEMHTGTRVDQCHISEDQWISGKTYADNSRAKNAVCGGYRYDFLERYRVIDTDDNYCAMVSDAYTSIDEEFFPKEANHKSKPIILFKRPQEVSYLCQKALYNSYLNNTEMKALCNSKMCKTIEGFPRKNFERIVDNYMKQVAVYNGILDGK